MTLRDPSDSEPMSRCAAVAFVAFNLWLAYRLGYSAGARDACDAFAGSFSRALRPLVR